MLSFAIPGTVIGVTYILAFNVPPIEITGTGLILVIAFVFRNMPVGVRSGIAGLSQIDKSLDEASTTLRARSFTTLRRVMLPLLRPALVSALVYSFVRSMTAVSAVIFLVSAEYNLATAYIVGRVEAGEFGLAIAYSSVLIVVMALGIGLIQLGVGERKLGRRAAPVAVAAARARASDKEPCCHGQGRPRLSRIPQCQHALRRGDGRRQCQLQHRGRQAGDAARPLRLRQDHDAADDRRPRDRQRGPDPDRRQGRDQAVGRRPRRQHGVPVLCALSRI